MFLSSENIGDFLLSTMAGLAGVAFAFLTFRILASEYGFMGAAVWGTFVTVISWTIYKALR